jgi:uncharacterized protein YggU (UPF0235/DUF167 family)
MHNAAQLAIRDTAAGAVLAVKVVPGASRDRLVGPLGDCLKITTATAAQKGRANASVEAILARALGVGARNVELISGAANARKEFLVRGMTAKVLRKAIEAL